MHAAQVAAAIRCQIAARIFLFLTVAEQRAVETADLRRPGQLHEGFRLGDTNQFGGLRTVAQIVAGAVGKQVHRGAIDQLEALLGDAFPVVGRDTLAHDLAGHGYELQIEIFDALGINHLANFFDLLVAAFGFDEFFEICCHCFSLPEYVARTGYKTPPRRLLQPLSPGPFVAGPQPKTDRLK